MANIRTETIRDEITVVTIDRPERRNALDSATLSELHAAFDAIAAQTAIRAVVLTGAGSAFSSGADIKAQGVDQDLSSAPPIGTVLAETDDPLIRTLAAQELMASLFEKIHRLRQPVIAAVNGAAVGGGFALALACDIRFASPAAAFGAVFIRHGVSACDMGTSYYLPRLIGAARSAELMLTGRVFDAAEAESIGLVMPVVAAEELVARAIDKAAEIAVYSPLAVWMTKETMWQNVDAPSLRHAIDMENRTQVMCTASGDLSSSFQAFRER
jgi:enoyl-CoA hydratase